MADRQFFKCSECRRRKCKCRPGNRRWDNHTREKCDSCRDKRLDCGPNINTQGQTGAYSGPNHTFVNISPPRIYHNPIPRPESQPSWVNTATPKQHLTRAATSQYGQQHLWNPQAPVLQHQRGVSSTHPRAPPINPPQQHMWSPQAVPDQQHPWGPPVMYGPRPSSQSPRFLVNSMPSPAARESQRIPGSPKHLSNVSAIRPESSGTAQRPMTLVESGFNETYPLVEIHGWLRQYETSLCKYRLAGQTLESTASDDRENAVGLFLHRIRDLFQDRVDEMVRAIEQYPPPGKHDLLRQLQDITERFLGDLPTCDPGRSSEHQELPVSGTTFQGLLDVCKTIADKLAEEYTGRGFHIPAFWNRRLSHGASRKPSDEDHSVSENEIDTFLASFGQVQQKIIHILRIKVQRPVAKCFMHEHLRPISSGHYALLSHNRSVAHQLYMLGHWTLNELDFLRRGPVHIAAQLGDVRLLQLINGREPEAIRNTLGDIYGLSPLCIAAIHGHLEAFKFLIRQGANIETRDRYGKHALYFSASRGDSSLVDCQLRNGYTAQDGTDMCSPLHVAAAGGYQDVINLLLQAGADPRTLFDGHTAASLAARYSYHELQSQLFRAQEEWNEREFQNPPQTQVSNAHIPPDGHEKQAFHQEDDLVNNQRFNNYDNVGAPSWNSSSLSSNQHTSDYEIHDSSSHDFEKDFGQFFSSTDDSSDNILETTHSRSNNSRRT